MDSTKLYDQWPTGFCCKEEDRQVWLGRIGRSIHLFSSNKILNNDKEDETMVMTIMVDEMLESVEVVMAIMKMVLRMESWLNQSLP